MSTWYSIFSVITAFLPLTQLLQAASYPPLKKSCAQIFSEGSNQVLHYRSELFITPKGVTTEEAWQDVAHLLFTWIQKKEQAHFKADYTYDAFVRGVDWKMTRENSVETKSSWSKDATSPEYFAIRYRHPDSTTRARQWKVDAGLTKMNDGSISLSLAVEYSTGPHYLGPVPPPPPRSTPNIITNVLRSDKWDVRSGTIKVQAHPIYIRLGEVHILRNAIEDPKRRMPIILVTQMNQSGKHLVDVKMLAQRLAGSAIVMALNETENGIRDLSEEMKELIPTAYRTWNGGIRVYHPDLNLRATEQSYRHPFLMGQSILEMNNEADGLIINFLTQNVYRSHIHEKVINKNGVVLTVEDVNLLHQKVQKDLLDKEKESLVTELNQLLTHAKDTQELQEWQKLAETYANLTEKYKQELFQRDEEIKDLRRRLEELLRILDFESREKEADQPVVVLKRIKNFQDQRIEAAFTTLEFDPELNRGEYQRHVGKFGSFPWSRYAKKIFEQLTKLNDAKNIEEINNQTGKGKFKRYSKDKLYGDYFALEADKQWRILFTWNESESVAENVIIDDYHND